jgi:hypothetical protein
MDDGEGAIVIEEGGAGGSGGDEGGSGGGDEEVDLGETGGGADDAGGGEGDDDPANREIDPDQRRGGQPTNANALRKVLRELATNNPDLAKNFPRLEKDVTAALFSRGEVDKLGGIRVVSDVIERVEALGGMEKINEDYEELEAGRQLEQGLERGDPAVIAGWAKDFPDGFQRSVLPMFEQLEKLNDERAEEVGAAIFTRMAEKFGMFNGLAELGSAIQSMKADDPAKANAVKLYNDIARFTQQAKTLGAKAKANPFAARSEELDRREQSITEKDKAAFRSAVGAEVGTQTIREMNRMLTEKLRDMKIYRVPSRTANRMRANISAEIKRQLSADPSYAREFNRIAATGDRERAIAYVVKSSSRRMAKAIAAVLPDFNLRPTGKTGGSRRFSSTGQGARNSSGGGNNSVSGVPKTSDVDFNRTDKAYWLGHKSSHFTQPGKAYGRDGKIYKWGGA